MTYTKVSIPKSKGGNAGTPRAKSPNVIFVLVRDLEENGFPTRDANGVKSTSNLTLKAGATAQAVYISPTTINRFDSAEGDPDKKGFTQNFAGEHPGDELAFAEWLQNNLNEDFLIISEDCGDNKGTRLHGTPCNPMKLDVEGQDNNEGVMSTLTLAQAQRGLYKAMHYVGTKPALAPNYTDGSGSGGGGL